MTDLLKMIHSMKSLYDHLCMDVMQAYHLTRSELDILLFLHNNPEFDSAKDIVEKRGLVKSHASMGIEKLIQKGYLKTVQDQKDKRRYHLYLLTSSQPIIEAGLKAQKRFNDILFQGISEDELKCWENILRQMSYNIIGGKGEI